MKRKFSPVRPDQLVGKTVASVDIVTETTEVGKISTLRGIVFDDGSAVYLTPIQSFCGVGYIGPAKRSRGSSKAAKLAGVARGVLTALSYPRGSEAQVRCLEEVGQDAKRAIGGAP